MAKLAIARAEDRFVRPPLPMGELLVRWDGVTASQWPHLLKRAARCNLWQSLAFANAVSATRQLQPRFGVIEVGGKAVGCVQIQEFSLLGVDAVVLQQGPLWFEEPAPLLWWRGFLDVVVRRWPRRFLRRRKFTFDLTECDGNRRLVESAGFRPAQGPGRTSIRLDLTQSDAALEADLRPEWRHRLRHAERALIRTEIDENGELLRWLTDACTKDRAWRRGDNPARGILEALAAAACADGSAFILRATGGGAALAGALFIGHGRDATYCAGWTSEAGEAAGAQHLLLWRALPLLKSKRYRRLDLGGTNAQADAGAISLKRGMGGEPYQLLPLCR
jgi:hypothetical protein